MWKYQPETKDYHRGIAKHIEDPSKCVSLTIDADDQVTDAQCCAMAEALNVHEQTGLTPSQLQARVAELEAAMGRALQIGHTLNFEHANDPTVDHNGRTADAVLDAYNGLRDAATSVGVWTK